LIERVVHRQLSTHLGDFNLLPDRQSAYRTNYSTETALLGLYNDLLCTFDADQATAVCFLHLTAAFDTIDHTFYSTLFQLVMALLLMPYSGLHLTFLVAPSVFVLVAASPRVFQFLMVFLKAPSMVKSFLFFWFLPFPTKPQLMASLLISILMAQMTKLSSNFTLKPTTLTNGLLSQTLVTGFVALIDGFLINMSS
jgi:hypothetical protein